MNFKPAVNSSRMVNDFQDLLMKIYVDMEQSLLVKRYIHNATAEYQSEFKGKSKKLHKSLCPNIKIIDYASPINSFNSKN